LQVALPARLYLEQLQQGAALAGFALAGAIVTAQAGGRRLAVAVESLATDAPPAGWQARLDQFAELAAGDATPGVLIWLPPGAELPADDPGMALVVQAVQEALHKLQPGEAGEAALPIRLAIQKRDDTGAYVSALGGLAPHWARFTDRVNGYFQIDSTQLHRLPGDPAYLDGLVDALVAASRALAVGQTAFVDALDHWRVQRLQGGAGCVALGLPPGDESENGAPLRRRLRATVRDVRPALQAAPADVRVLLLVGHYASMEGEPVGPALRGMDPALFGGLDLVALAADGAVRTLLDITRRTYPPALS
jgi:hypothetical protein